MIEFDPLLPRCIRFIPIRRTRTNPQDWVKARAIWLDGRETAATAADISLVVNRQFFQAETKRIGRERLVLWLNGVLSDEEAATIGSNGEIDLIKRLRKNNQQETKHD